MKSVAIAGFAFTTLDALKDSQADEIWTLNHAFLMAWAFPRFDRVFEIHKLDWALRPELPKSGEYEAWLKEPHPFPIYMQEASPEYPASVRYPFEEVCADVFGKLLRGGEMNPYFTSSFSYMLALAVYEKFERVELYGIEMATDTEYYFQKPSGELMIGVALGRGVEVVLQPQSKLCRAQLYAYDRVPAVERTRAEYLLGLYQKEHERYNQEYKDLREGFNQRQHNDEQALMKAHALTATYDGGAGMLHKLITEGEYYLGRQSLEKQRIAYRQEEESWLARCNEALAVYKTYTRLDTDGQAGQKWKEYLAARWNMYAYSGARQALQKLIHECDMKVVPDNLRLEILDT